MDLLIFYLFKDRLSELPQRLEVASSHAVYFQDLSPRRTQHYASRYKSDGWVGRPFLL